MKFLEALSYIYFGCPKNWNGKPVDEKKRFIIKMIITLATIILIVSVGVFFIVSGAILYGVVLLCFAVVIYILSYRDFRNHNK